MRSFVISLVLLAGVATHAAAQRPSITRPIQQAREAAAKSGARTAAAEAAGQEPAVRRDSVPVTTAPVITATKPGTSKANGNTPSAKPTAPANGTAAGKATAPVNTNAPASTAAADSTRTVTAPNTKAPVTTKAGAPATASAANSTTPATSDKSGASVPPPQAGTSKTAPGAPKGGVAATTDKAATTPTSRTDSSAATVSVGSLAVPSRPELRIDREVFTYDAGGRRDPFVSLLSTSDLRPLFSDLLLVVINYDPQRRNSVAIMRDATTKEQYRVRQGQLIGRMRVAAIEQKRVLFTIDEFGFSRQESLVIGDTTKVRKQ
jgi:hypothetical protein